MSKHTLRLLAAAGLFLGALSTVQPVSGQRGGPVTIPEGPGKAEVEKTCTVCHGLNMITWRLGLHPAGVERDVRFDGETA